MNGQLAHLTIRALAKRIKHADAFNLIAKEIQPDRRGKRAGKNIQNTAAQGKFTKFPYRLGTYKAISGQKIANIILGDFLPCLYRTGNFQQKRTKAAIFAASYSWWSIPLFLIRQPRPPLLSGARQRGFQSVAR